ncbi:MAG TPA: class I SAM-dependent methyltransferase [Acidimicrobiia bacterium]|nr:class I SAM-dependent methyltransferase [Acidimicrobiia bacterium]
MDAADWDERYRSAGLLWSADPNVFVKTRLGNRPPGRGVDLGCGEGRNAIWLAELGWEMVAVDFSGVALDRGRQRSGAVSFIEADVFAWQPSGLFDLVLIAYLQVGWERLHSLIRSATGWLAPGAELFMIGHDQSNIEFGVGGPQVPEILWDVDRIVSALGGLEIVEAGVLRRPVEVENGVGHARDALVRAARRF